MFTWLCEISHAKSRQTLAIPKTCKLTPTWVIKTTTRQLVKEKRNRCLLCSHVLRADASYCNRCSHGITPEWLPKLLIYNDFNQSGFITQHLPIDGILQCIF